MRITYANIIFTGRGKGKVKESKERLQRTNESERKLEERTKQQEKNDNRKHETLAHTRRQGARDLRIGLREHGTHGTRNRYQGRGDLRCGEAIACNLQRPSTGRRRLAVSEHLRVRDHRSVVEVNCGKGREGANVHVQPKGKWKLHGNQGPDRSLPVLLTCPEMLS